MNDENENEVMDYEDESHEVMDYRQTLNYTQRVRKHLVQSQTARGLPQDKEGVEMLLKTLKDMDGTAINDRRNSIEEGNADSARKVADAMTTFIRENKNPFRASDDGDVIPGPPTLNREKLPSVTHAEGETHIGTIIETSEEFTDRMEPIYQQHFDDDDDA